MSVYEILAPDGRILRMEHASLDELNKQLVLGYKVVGRVIGMAHDLSGGIVDKLEGTSIMKELLDHHGDELLAWLKENL